MSALTSDTQIILGSFFASVCFLTIAYHRGFFTLKNPHDKFSLVNLKDTAIALIIFCGFFYALAPLTMHLFLKFTMQHALFTVAIIQFFYTILIGIGFFFLFKKMDVAIRKHILKDPKNSPSTIPFDIAIGIITWLVAMPTVAFVNTVTHLIVEHLTGFEGIEQTAVRYLKMTLNSQIPFYLAIFSTVIAAPILEEILFRGFILNLIKKYLGPKCAIILSAIIFALFHYAASQGFGNISLILSLIVLGSFLGLLYEKQRSIFASIALHMTFNSLGVMRIIFTLET